MRARGGLFKKQKKGLKMIGVTKGMTEKQKKGFSELAEKMRVLKGPEKSKYLYELDEYAKDCRVREAYQQPLDIILPHRIAQHVYQSLEGKSYDQPGQVSQADWEKNLARQKFESIFEGVAAYAKASDEERKVFKKSALTPVSCPAVTKVASLLKTSQNG